MSTDVYEKNKSCFLSLFIPILYEQLLTFYFNYMKSILSEKENCL